jgi:hypothetical protein
LPNIEKLSTILNNIERMFALLADTKIIQTQLLKCGIPEDEILTGLSIKGIGPWTVAYAKMHGQSSLDIWLNAVLMIKKQLAKMNINAELARP